MRFYRTQRLRKSFDFNKIKEYGIRIHSGPFLLCFLTKDNLSPHPLRRVGIICSRKVGNAVARNRAKRLLREVFRHNQEILPYHLDLVIIARPFIVQYNYAALKAFFIEGSKRLSSPEQRKE